MQANSKPELPFTFYLADKQTDDAPKTIIPMQSVKNLSASKDPVSAASTKPHSSAVKTMNPQVMRKPLCVEAIF